MAAKTSRKTSKYNFRITTNPELVKGTSNSLYVSFRYSATVSKKKTNAYAKGHISKFTVTWKYKFIGNKNSTTKTAKTAQISTEDVTKSDSNGYYTSVLSSFPENAISVWCTIAPVWKTHKVDGKQVKWVSKNMTLTSKSYAPPASTATKATDPTNAPSMELVTSGEHDGYLKVTIDNYTPNTYLNVDKYPVKIELRIYKATYESKGYTYSQEHKASSLNYLENKCIYYYKPKSTDGSPYTCNFQVTQNGDKSTWSSYSSLVYTKLGKYSGNITTRQINKSTVLVTWDEISNVSKYGYQYVKDSDNTYYSNTGVSPTTITSNTISIFDYYSAQTTETTTASATLDLGDSYGGTYYFRVKVLAAGENQNESSEWSDIVTITAGKKPSPPTTWSERSTYNAGETMYLHWIHNATDGSLQTYARIVLTGYVVSLDEDGNRERTLAWAEPITAEPESEKTITTDSDTTRTYTHVADSNVGEIDWYVVTKGALNEESDPSTVRTITVVTEPSFTLNINDVNDESVPITQYPITINLSASGAGQYPVAYYVSISNDENYPAYNDYGEEVQILADTILYSNSIDTSDEEYELVLTPSDVTLLDGQTYTVSAYAVMSTGITTDTLTITVAPDFDDIEYNVDGTIALSDSGDISLTISPTATIMLKSDGTVDDVYYVDDGVIDNDDSVTEVEESDEEDDDGTTDELVSGVCFTVYRKEFDGTFTQIGPKDFDNEDYMSVPDPHPSLNVARYRIVAKDMTTGQITYEDLDPYVIGEDSIIIQWDEKYSSYYKVYDETDEDDTELEYDDSVNTTSLLRLPYNVDVSENTTRDVSLIDYVGRTQPVSYYGTKIAHSGTWSCVIDDADDETLYQLRRLQSYMGDVYVREPSGLGYYANVSVSITQTHCEVTKSVSIEVKRVEGTEYDSE